MYPAKGHVGVGLGMRAPAVCILAAVAVACGSLTPHPAPLPFRQTDSVEYAAFSSNGQLELHAQAFLTTRSGQVRLPRGIR